MLATSSSSVSPAKRGVEAPSPWAMPWRAWIDILKRTAVGIGRNRVAFTAAGVAFYALLAVFPALAAMIALWSLFGDATTILNQIESARRFLPAEAADLIQTQASALAESDGGAISLALFVSVGFLVFSASRGATALMHALNIVYGEAERRNIFKFNLAATGITIGIAMWLLFALGAIIVLPALFSIVGYGGLGDRLVAWLRWPFLLVAAWAAISAIFRYAPCRKPARWAWITPGAALAVILWLAASIVFSVYVQNFANYNQTYGALGAGVILLMWFWVSSFVILIGAEFDAELEKQTEKDTTTGPEQPIGERGAFVADYPSPARSAADPYEGPPPDPRT